MKPEAELTRLIGASRYWTEQDVSTIVRLSSGDLPEITKAVKRDYSELIDAYWQHVQEENDVLFGQLNSQRRTRLNDLAEARSSIATKILDTGTQAVWAILDELFSGERYVHTAPSDWLQRTILDFGAVGAGFAANMFKHANWESRESFHMLGCAFLFRAKLMHALLLSLIGEEEIAGERVGLACLSARGSSLGTLQKLLKRAAKVSQTRTPAQAALAKVAEYKQGMEPDFAPDCPNEYPQDIIQEETRAVGKVQWISE